ncbi:MAG TPA: hypothetical protein VMX74_04405 [Pirellulales bacterium]|nr:hypothetical protein [Pirellulales bacterium]
MTEYFRVRNWKTFQHYSQRNPPWIKLHFEVLASEDWVTLDDASRVLFIACMLIASRNEGKVPNVPAYIKRVAYLNKSPNFKPLIECGFLEKVQADASKSQSMLADASTTLADASDSVSVSVSVSVSEDMDSTVKKEASPRVKPAETFSIQVAREFEEDFWPMYPRRLGKGAARKAFAKARVHADLSRITTGLERYMMTKPDQQDWCFPATFLNEERYDDDVDRTASRTEKQRNDDGGIYRALAESVEGPYFDDRRPELSPRGRGTDGGGKIIDHEGD